MLSAVWVNASQGPVAQAHQVQDAQAPQSQAAQPESESSRASADLQEQLVLGLSASGIEERMDHLIRLGVLLTGCPGSITDSTLKALSHTLRRDPSPVARALAARAFELGGDNRAVPHLLAALKKESQVSVRKAIAYALARYPSAVVSESLISLLQDKKQEVRAAAAHALAETRDPIAISSLIGVIKKRKGERDLFARSEAARGLGNIGSREAIPILIKALTDDESSEVRREAAIALGKIASAQDAEVIEALQAATLAADPYLTAAADTALASIKGRPE